ncbi:MAG: transporter [Myxococcaceae bacterium]|nr:transporter [Myxococcaceae bacterium]
MEAKAVAKKPLYLMALGAFAIATEGFMIAPLLPGIAEDLSVSVASAGQLVTVFALAYALSSPVLTALTGGLNRGRLLVGVLGAFAVANAVAWASTGFWHLMGARVLLALAAGLYLPNANAAAAALVPPEQRGKALAIVNGGASVAIALGVPLGAIVGGVGGWRMTFAGVAILALLGTVGLLIGLPKGFGKNMPTATLQQRVRVAREPAVLVALLSTTLWATGAYTVYTYVAAYVTTATAGSGLPMSVVLFVWGVSALLGMILGGRYTDRIGFKRVLVVSLTALILAFVSLSAIVAYVPPAHAAGPVLFAVVLWGVSVWGFIAPQQARLMSIAGINVAPVALSLNASFMYGGFALGALLGGITLNRVGVIHLGWVGASCELLALGVLLVTQRRSAPVRSLAPAE